MRTKQATDGDRRTPLLLLVLSLLIMWINYATTSRWAGVPGSIHGRKEPWFVLAIVIATALALWEFMRLRSAASPSSETFPRGAAFATFAAGCLLLSAGLFIWFPPHTWTQLPFLDNWPARYQSTMDLLDVWRSGAPVGWQWHYLGGYYVSSDITQNLSALAALPVALLGGPLGFHLLHFGLLLALPALVWLDFKVDDQGRRTHYLAAGLTGIIVTSWFSYYQLRSGDTNSLAGLTCTVAALTGSHAAARGRRWGNPLLFVAIAVVQYSHTGFFVYASLLLGLEALVYRDRKRAWRSAIAIATALVAALPLTWETWRYSGYFTFNNTSLDPIPFELAGFLRKIYYNVEFLFLPHRWFNDFPTLAIILIPVFAFTALRDRSRARFYAAGTLAVFFITLFDAPQFGYALQRPVHLLVVLPAGAIAGFLLHHLRSRVLLWSTIALCAIYLQYLWMPLPHIRSVADLDPALVGEIRTLDGALVLLENAPHRDMDVDPARIPAKTPFAAHLEGYLSAATGKRFYGGLWDGWQWSRYRSQVLAGGTFRGRAIALVPVDEFQAELARWGVRHLLVWSDAALAYLRGRAGFTERWRHGRWTRFEFLAADTRTATASTGTAELARYDPLGADVDLRGVTAGAEIVVRTNYFPAWTASADGLVLELYDRGGQLAFHAPTAGTYTVRLSYPRRRWTVVLAVFVLVAGFALANRKTAHG